MAPLLLLAALLCSLPLVVAQAQLPRVLSLSLGNGESPETFGRGNGVVTGWVDDDLIYAVSSRGNVFTVGESDGLLYNSYLRNDAAVCTTVLDWNEQDGTYTFGVYSVGNAVILIDYLGSYMEEFTVEGKIVGQPLVKDGIIFVAHNVGSDGIITMYDQAGDDADTKKWQRVVEDAQIGPLGGKEARENYLYFGTDQGTIWSIGTIPEFWFALTVFSGGGPDAPLVIDESVAGKPYVSNDAFLLPSPGGFLYWWRGEKSGSPDYRIAISADGSDADISPVLSKDGRSYYVIAGNSLHAVANTVPPSFLWTVVGKDKTTPIMDDGDIVYVVDGSGAVTALDSTSSQVRSGFPVSPCTSCGSTESVSSLTERALYITYSDGSLIGTCVTCAADSTPSPVSEPTPSPVSDPTPEPTDAPEPSQAPVEPDTDPEFPDVPLPPPPTSPPPDAPTAPEPTAPEPTAPEPTATEETPEPTLAEEAPTSPVARESSTAPASTAPVAEVPTAGFVPVSPVPSDSPKTASPTAITSNMTSNTQSPSPTIFDNSTNAPSVDTTIPPAFFSEIGDRSGATAMSGTLTALTVVFIFVVGLLHLLD